MAAITLDIGGNTRQLDRDIQKTVNKVYTINLKTKGDQPLGRITGKVNEFNKSLDASNARVIAFGASAGIIFGVERAFTALVSATIEVQKSLQDINVILNASQQNLQKFGAELFNIARNTGQSFQEVAKAATEFSRQGLGIEETLKRTNEALILSRLSGLDAAKSVESLTAAVNSFASQAVTATEVVNKFATVDAAFAVSSADLADAIARVGSSAAQSGVSLNELIAIVTSAQQTTARGGAVIGNSFKTIFTRLQREKVVDLLESLGISGTDASGQVKSTIQLLQDLGKVYDTLGAQQQAYVAEQVGGVFQINILKAALADLGKEYSIYSSALNVAAGATDQAIRRNEELNKTYSAQINALQENARQLAAAGGERLLGPSIDRLVGGTNTLLKGFSESDGQGVGAVLGKGILDGLGQFIAGPGLALIGGVLLKLFRDLAKFATGSVQQLLGLNTAATQQRDLQQSINQILTKNPQLLELALKGEQGLNAAANNLLASLQKQTVELQKQAQVAQQISKAFVSQAGVRVAGGVPVVPTGKPGKAAGYIPNFASDKLIEKYTAISLGATRGVRPIMSQGTIGGKKFIMNNQEVEFPGVGKNGDSMVLPTYGDGPRIAAAGFIPNFAKSKTEKFTDFSGKYAYLVPFGTPDGILPTEKIGQYKVGGIPIKSPKKVDIEKDADKDSLNLYDNIKKIIVEEAFRYTNTIRPLNKGVNIDTIKSKFETTAGAAGALKGAAGAAFEVGIISALDYQSASRRGDVAGNFDVRGGANLAQIQDLFDLRPSVGLADFKVNADPSNVKKFYDKVRKEEKAGVFDDREQIRNINRDAEVEVARELAKDENLKKWIISGNKISAKAPDFVKKMVEERKNLIRPRYNLASFPKGPVRAAGFIPNFAPLKLMGDRKKEYEDFVLEPVRGGKLKDKLWDRNPTREQRLRRIQQSKENKAAFDKIKNLPITANALDNLKFYRDKRSDQYDSSGKMVLYKDRDGLLNSREVRSHEYSGLESNAITVENGRVVLEDYSPNSSKKIPFNSEFKPLVSTMASALGMGVTTRSALTKQLSTSRIAAIRNSPLYKAEGFIPNFAAIQAPLQNAINNEIAAGASPNQIRVDKNSKLKTSLNPDGFGVWSKKYEGSLPEGIKMAEKAGINPKTKGMSKAGGYIPNFAIEDPDVQATDTGTALAAVTAQLSGLAFAFAFNKEELKQSLEEITQKNKEQGKATTRLTKAQINAITDLRKSGQITGAEALSRLDAARYAPTGGQKFGGFLKANAFGLSAAAPILGETIKNVVGQETPGARKTGAIASAAGQIGSFAATGALIAPGPVGAGVGAAVGALLTIPSLVDELTSSMPELAAAANKASQDLTKFGDVGQRLLTASSELSRLLTEGGSQEAISKAQDVYAKALSELSDTDRDRLSAAAKVGKLEEEYAKVLQEKVEQTRSTERFVKLQALEEKKNFGIVPAGFDTDSKTRQGRANIETLGNAFKGFFTTTTTLPQDLKDQIKAGNLTEQQAILQNFQKQKDIGLSQLQELQNATDALKGRSGKVTQEEMSLITGKEENLASILQNIIPESETKAEDINQLVNLADDSAEAFSNVLKVLIDTLNEGPEVLKKSIEQAKLDAEANKARTEALKKSSEAINATISTIQKNIAVQNLLARTLDVTSESFRSIAADINIARKFTQPAEALEQVIGTDKAPAMELRAQSDIALNQENLRSGIANAGIDLKDTIRGIFQKPFQEQRDELTKKLSQTNLTGTTEEIETETAKIIDQYKPLFEQNDKANENLEKYLSAFVSGQISQEQLLNDLRNEMSSVGIDVNKGTQASNEVELAIANFNARTIQEQVKAFQQRAKLANETKQAILQDKINQAIGVFGGFEGFMNRPEEEQNYIQKILPDLEKIQDIRESTTFRYNNPESLAAQQKLAPDLGRSFAKVYKELIDQSGGAFRSVIQSAIDAGPQLTGFENRDGKAGASALGGFDDIIAGRAADFEQQLKLAEDQLKITTDPALKRDLQGFIDSIRNMPGGTLGTAEIQTMRELGVGRQSRFKDLYGQYEVQALKELEKISPELAASLADATSLTNDPILDQATYQSNVQTQMLGYLGPIQDAILQIANLGGGTGQVGTETKQIEAYKPKLTEEQQKKADEFRKKQEEVLKKEADIKAKKAQEAAMPKRKLSIAEIEAETRAKRDQKYLQSQLAPRSRETGKKFESIAQIENEMTKLRSGTFGPLSKEDGQYYRVLENFKASLNPVKQTSGNYYDRITSSAGYNFREGMYSQDINRNTPMSRTTQIQSEIERARDQKLMGVITPQSILSPNLSLGPNMAVGQQDVQAQIKSQTKPLTEIGTVLRPLSEISNDVTRATYDMDVKRKGLYDGDFGRELQRRKLQENPLLTLTPQNITTEGATPLNPINQQSFTQQEATFNNNTSAITNLTAGIENLATTVSTLQENANQNAPNVATTNNQQQGTPNVTTNTNAPINVTVNAQGGGDIAIAVGEAVQNAIPQIIEKVRLAMGEKVPPTASAATVTNSKGQTIPKAYTGRI